MAIVKHTVSQGSCPPVFEKKDNGLNFSPAYRVQENHIEKYLPEFFCERYCPQPCEDSKSVTCNIDTRKLLERLRNHEFLMEVRSCSRDKTVRNPLCFRLDYASLPDVTVVAADPATKFNEMRKALDVMANKGLENLTEAHYNCAVVFGMIGRYHCTISIAIPAFQSRMVLYGEYQGQTHKDLGLVQSSFSDYVSKGSAPIVFIDHHSLYDLDPQFRARCGDLYSLDHPTLLVQFNCHKYDDTAFSENVKSMHPVRFTANARPTTYTGNYDLHREDFGLRFVCSEVIDMPLKKPRLLHEDESDECIDDCEDSGDSEEDESDDDDSDDEEDGDPKVFLATLTKRKRDEPETTNKNQRLIVLLDESIVNDVPLTTSHQPEC